MEYIRKMAVGLLLTSMAQAAVADGYECTFPIICHEALDCTEDRTMTVTITEDEDGQPLMVLPGFTTSAFKQVDEEPGLVSGTVSYVSNLERNIVHMLTIFEDGRARHTAHSWLGGPFAIVARGQCTPS